MESRTASRQHATHPMSYYREMVKDMDDSQKLELVSIIIDSLKPIVAPQPMRHYTMDEINTMLDEAEADIAAGRVIDHEDLMREWEEELAREEQKELELQMAEVL